MDKRVWSKLYIRRHRDTQPRHPFGYAGCVDRYVDMLGICDTDARRPLLRHLFLYYICGVAVVAVCHDIQSAFHQRFEVVAGAWTVETSAGRVREVCHGTRIGKVYEHVWLFDTQDEGCRDDLGHHFCANDLYYTSERDRLRLGLPVVSADALQGGNAWQRLVYGSGCRGILCCGHKI